MGSLIRLANSDGSVLFNRNLENLSLAKEKKKMQSSISNSPRESSPDQSEANSSLLMNRIKLILSAAFAHDSSRYPERIQEVAL